MIHKGIRNHSKLIVIVIIAVIALAVGHYIFQSLQRGIIKIDNGAIPSTGEYCFTRTQKATKDAPYNVEEHIVLNFDDSRVTGTKRGTQNGPNMNNGYEGTLEGSIIENEMELTYAYTIEGSQNRELEVYTFTNEDLVKKRWALKDKIINGKSILVPDYIG